MVLVWALDRFTREGVAETFQHIKRLASHSVHFVSFTEENFRTTGPAGEPMIAVALDCQTGAGQDFSKGAGRVEQSPGAWQQERQAGRTARRRLPGGSTPCQNRPGGAL